MQLSQERLSKAKRDQPLDRFWDRYGICLRSSKPLRLG